MAVKFEKGYKSFGKPYDHFELIFDLSKYNKIYTGKIEDLRTFNEEEIQIKRQKRIERLFIEKFLLRTF